LWAKPFGWGVLLLLAHLVRLAECGSVVASLAASRREPPSFAKAMVDSSNSDGRIIGIRLGFMPRGEGTALP
jgi:hypothetical protein